MTSQEVTVAGMRMEVICLNTIIVGSGASALNAADRLYGFGQTDIAIVTEGLNTGTSRNAGSDKQTYYKLTLAADVPDSVLDMAQTLFQGGAMDGDLALCEAALSAMSFYRLVEIGVPFPHNAAGEFVGYKTDHDPRQRATSAGPLTSKMMTEKLQRQITGKNIPVFDGYMVVRVLTAGESCVGVLCINKNALGNPNGRYTVFYATNTIYATGGPAGLYACSVYPTGQSGASGFAFEAGVKGKNMTEWQYGIASTKFRWNLSGTYQQVLPRYISTDSHGNDLKEFLGQYFKCKDQLLRAIFLKGYQWPFGARKVSGAGSSLIDLLVYHETQIKGRRVWLDFTQNPRELKADFSNVGTECFDYLKKSDALFGTPVQRLAHMNAQAIELFLSNGIDLTKEPLEIAVCAQHNNGGLDGNTWWESNIKHFFPIGEASGTHGIYRPGGSALNSGQCAGLRCAQFIAARYSGDPADVDMLPESTKWAIAERISQMEGLICASGIGNSRDLRQRLGERMSRQAAHIRSEAGVAGVLQAAQEEYRNYWEVAKISDISELPLAMSNYDLLIAQQVCAAAMLDYIRQNGGSRGSYLIVRAGNPLLKVLSEDITIDCSLQGRIQEVVFDKGGTVCNWRDVRPIPKLNYWFETVWNTYANDAVIR